MRDFAEALRSGRVLLMDGAMGTEFLRRVPAPSLEFAAQYYLGNSAIVRSIHQSYVDAGAEVLLTNTFQANPVALARRGLSDFHHEIWQAAIQSAQVDPVRPRFVLADIGPIETCTREIAATLLSECVNVDGILLETWSSLDDLKCFVDRRDASSLPLLVSFTFHRADDLRTIAGIRPEDCARAANRYGATAVGSNCGKEIGMDDMLEIARRYHAACDLPVFVRPNAGSPTKTGLHYPRSPASLAAGLIPLLREGVAMIGGCCGTTPEHIRAFRSTIDEWERGKK